MCSVRAVPGVVAIFPLDVPTTVLGSPVYQFLRVPVLLHTNFTGWLRVGVIVIGVVGSSVPPTVIVLIADGLATDCTYSIY